VLIDFDRRVNIRVCGLVFTSKEYILFGVRLKGISVGPVLKTFLDDVPRWGYMFPFLVSGKNPA
jgi:hypothetical protein